MKSGRKPSAPSTKLARGTYRPSRDGSRIEVTASEDLPQAPHWLTAGGRDVWLDLVSRVERTRAACELDSDLLATLANLIAATGACWGSGAVPPAAHLAELRRLSELFGLAGVASRVSIATPAPSFGNTFARNALPPDGGSRD